MSNTRLRRAALAGGTLAAFLSAGITPAPVRACGCFAPPNPAVPVVQAGERILFSEQDGTVTAHIQIQYQGQPEAFGWLLPLPSLPKDKNGNTGIDVGVDELFSSLITATQPKYEVQRVYEQCGNSRVNFGGGTAEDAPGAGPSPSPPQGAGSPLVVEESVGHYVAAVLKADNKDEMLKWLNDNHFVVPAGTDSVVAPYIHAGAYFVALKLQAGASAGDIQPVVVRYQSDLPMIPIVLTSVAANPHMGIQVWMLGKGRAIPRNYYHDVIDDAQIDWLNAGKNYNDVIIKAVGEANGKHAFVTEYAGTSGIVQNLAPPTRFSAIDQLKTDTDPVAFVEDALGRNGFALNGQFTSLMATYIPEPAALQAQNVSLGQYYQQLRFFLDQDRTQNPDKYADIAAALAAFDPVKAAGDLDTSIAQPTRDAAALLASQPYMTRLYSTLSPEDMNKDPVFSYNPDLKDYSNVHNATLTFHCSSFFGNGQYSSATLVTEQGWHIAYSVDDAQSNKFTPFNLPYSLRIETLGEMGAPTVVADNSGAIGGKFSSGGCAAGRGQDAGLLGLLLGSAALLLARRRAWQGAR